MPRADKYTSRWPARHPKPPRPEIPQCQELPEGFGAIRRARFHREAPDGTQTLVSPDAEIVTVAESPRVVVVVAYGSPK